MTEVTTNRLRFGYNAGLPNGCATAWGARLIWPDDLVWDRQDSFGDFEGLKPWLDQALPKALAEARRLATSGLLHSSEELEVTLYEDEEGIILGNPNASYGYFYIVTYKK